MIKNVLLNSLEVKKPLRTPSTKKKKSTPKTPGSLLSSSYSTSNIPSSSSNSALSSSSSNSRFSTAFSSAKPNDNYISLEPIETTTTTSTTTTTTESSEDITISTPATKSEPILTATTRTLFVPISESRPPVYASTSGDNSQASISGSGLTKTLVRQTSQSSPSVHISKVRNNDPDPIFEVENSNRRQLAPDAPDVSSLLKHWASLYHSVSKTQDDGDIKNTKNNDNRIHSTYLESSTASSTTKDRPKLPYYQILGFPSLKTSTTTTTLSTTTTVRTTTTTSTTTTSSLPVKSSTTSSTTPSTTDTSWTSMKNLANQLKNKWSMLANANSKLDNLNKYKKKAGYFAHGNPVRIIHEAISVSTSTSTEVNMVPVDDKVDSNNNNNVNAGVNNNEVLEMNIVGLGAGDTYVPYPYVNSAITTKKPQTSASRPLKSSSSTNNTNEDGRIKSTNVPPNLWLTAKDILNNLGSKLLIKNNNSKKDGSSNNYNKDMTNSPIVIIPVQDESRPRPAVNVQALKPIVSKNPITFINMNNVKMRPNPKKPMAVIEKLVEPPPSKQYIWTKYNQTYGGGVGGSSGNNLITKYKRPLLKPFQASSNIVQISQFPIETTTIGIRKPPWENANEPNKGIGTVEELQLPSPVNVQSLVIKTDLTPEVMNNLKSSIEEQSTSTEEEEDFLNFFDNGDKLEISNEDEDYAPLASPNSDHYYAIVSSSEKINFDDLDVDMEMNVHSSDLLVNSDEDYAPISLPLNLGGSQVQV